jgi:hypothetical protein
MIGKACSGLAAVTLLSGTALTAEPPTDRPIARNSGDRQICRTYREVGTRLGGYRACHTAQEWAELRRQTVANVDHIQNARPMNGN